MKPNSNAISSTQNSKCRPAVFKTHMISMQIIVSHSRVGKKTQNKIPLQDSSHPLRRVLNLSLSPWRKEWATANSWLEKHTKTTHIHRTVDGSRQAQRIQTVWDLTVLLPISPVVPGHFPCADGRERVAAARQPSGSWRRWADRGEGQLSRPPTRPCTHLPSTWATING